MKKNIENQIKRNIEFLHWFDKLMRIAFVMILIVAIIVVFLLIQYYKQTEAYAYEPEKLTFEEIVEHDEEVRYQQWLLTQPTECHTEHTEEESYRIEVTEEDINLMARVVMSEGSVLSQEAKQAIATTIVNRVLAKSGEFAALNTVEEVVYHGAAFSTQDNGEPDETCYQAVYDSLTYEVFPLSMVWFREGKFHSYGYPYMQIGSTYFSCYEDYWQ